MNSAKSNDWVNDCRNQKPMLNMKFKAMSKRQSRLCQQLRLSKYPIFHALIDVLESVIANIHYTLEHRLIPISFPIKHFKASSLL